MAGPGIIYNVVDNDPLPVSEWLLAQRVAVQFPTI